MSHNEQQQAEVDWYLKNGRFPQQRIRRDGNGDLYVIGDMAWNAKASTTDFEQVEPRMPRIAITKRPTNTETAKP